METCLHVQDLFQSKTLFIFQVDFILKCIEENNKKMKEYIDYSKLF